MKSPIKIVICILCALFILIGVFESSNLFTIFSRIAFKTCLFITLLEFRPVKISRKYFLFLILIFLADALSLCAYFDSSFWGSSIVLVFFLMYLVLIIDGWKQFKVGRFNTVALSYCIIMSINAGLIFLQLRSVFKYMVSTPIMIGSQIIYHITLWSVCAVSVAYYLNSYSRKSMVFLLGSLLFVFADIFNGAYLFYGMDRLILPFSALMSVGGYFFFFNYFHIKENPLLTEAEILLDIENNEKSKRPIEG